MKNTKNNDAVSPVVGVMLMLVVTIIIATVVASFASGLGSDTSNTPTAVFTENVQSNGGFLSLVTLTHKGGDTLSVAEVKLLLNVYGETKTYSVSNENLDAPFGNAINPGDDIVATVTMSDYIQSGSPVKYTLVDLTSGNAIASGTFVVP
ncbi:type IV pilin N-terminal domain-containing protein [uncultured Methanocorpusculum sp.]|nr:type IV pilin N-terminal domain-containing protein [uncultured Methanocorpusculum sp.]